MRQFQGRSDAPLNETGILQAREAREKLLSEREEFDVCFASPLKRALQTAKIVCFGEIKDKETHNATNSEKSDILHGDFNNFRVERLIAERDLGNLEGKQESDFDQQSTWDVSRNISTGGIERISDLYLRALNFYKLLDNNIRSEFGNDAKILVVSHGGFLRVFHFIMLGGRIVFNEDGTAIVDETSEAYLEAFSSSLKNCEYRKYDF